MRAALLPFPLLPLLLGLTLGQAASPAPRSSGPLPALPASTVTGAPGQLAPVSARICAPQASPNGVTDDTAALQRALDACGGQDGQPGGTVTLAAGRYLTGPLTLRGGETLNLAAGAVLLGTTDAAAYRGTGRGAGNSLRPLLGGQNLQNLRLTGAGTIDGQGQGWWAAVRAARAAGQPDPQRPRLIALDQVQHLLVQGLTLKDSPSFHLVPSHAQDVTVSGVTVTAPADSPNTDGVDPADARDVTIENSSFDTGDDDIAVKAGDPDPQHPGAASGNILVQHCTFLHGHGLSIGSETTGGVVGVWGHDLTFTGTDAGLKIKTLRGRGGVVDDLQYDRVTMTDVKVALSFAAYYPKVPAADAAQPDAALPLTPATPDLRRVAVSNLTVTGAAQLGVVAGLPERPSLSVTLTRATMSGARGLSVQNAALTLLNSRLSVQQGADVVAGPGARVTRQTN